MKAKAKVYRGIEFVSVGELPADQQLLLQHAQEPERIKILMDGKILSNCIQYSEYTNWFSAVYERSISSVKVTSVKHETVPMKIVLSKA